LQVENCRRLKENEKKRKTMTLLPKKEMRMPKREARRCTLPTNGNGMMVHRGGKA